MEELNPYAAPKAGLLKDDSNAARLRHEYLRTESHLKAIGVLLIFGATLSFLAQWMMAHILANVFRTFTMSVWTGLKVLPVVIGAGICFLKPWAWKAACLGLVLMMFLGLVRFPQGLADVLIYAVVLRFLLSNMSRHVFSPSHQEIISLTPLMQSKTARWVYILMAVVTSLLGLAYVTIGR